MSKTQDNVLKLTPRIALKGTPQLPQAAAVVELQQPAKPKTRVERKRDSQIIKTAVTYCCNKGTFEAGFTADNTADWLFAGAGGIVGEAHFRKAKRSIHQLITMMNKATGQ